jgi:hypothetical protein
MLSIPKTRQILVWPTFYQFVTGQTFPNRSASSLERFCTVIQTHVPRGARDFFCLVSQEEVITAS